MWGVKGVEEMRGDKTRARVRRQIQAYFTDCDEGKRRCTLSGLKVAVGATGVKWKKLMEDELLRPDLELAVERIRDALEQRGDTMAVMLRKELGGTGTAGVEPLEVKFGGSGDDYGG